MRTPLRSAIGALAAVGLLTVGAPQAALADSAPDVASDEQFTALQRDLGLTSSQAADLITTETEARALERELSDELGADFGGAVLDTDSGVLTVSVTDAAAVPAVEDAGAEAVVVTHGEPALDAAVADLNAVAEEAQDGVTGWYVDTAADSVVLTVADGETAAAQALVAEAGVDSDAVRVTESAESPETFIDVVGGNPYYFQQGSQTFVCSIGFAVQGGYVTAGHCGGVGSDAYVDTAASQVLGTVQESVFPGAGDKGWVQTTPEHTLTSQVNGYDNPDVTVTGSDEAGIGASVCRSGRTTGWHCGTIESKNQTVNYPEGAVSGLTRTTACAEGGDSGGSWVSGSQAQGVTSGGSGNCSTGGTTYFQPVNPMLSDWNLTLVTG